jgi:predicted AAA+ superfamily ATPase
MLPRHCKPLKSKSFFLFGARGVGKTSLLKDFFKPEERCFWIDLLDEDLYRELMTRPSKFVELIPPDFRKGDWVVADEIQRIPQLLNYVHKLIEERKLNFALTGSSARKLKRTGVNLLAGRALMNTLHPFTHLELGDKFSLLDVLNWGSLPETLYLGSSIEKKEYLKSYVSTYIRQEIKEEQVVRNLEPFMRFLEVAAQANGQIVNFSKIGRFAQVEHKTVERYFEILIDTFLGFYLEPFHTSARKVQTKSSKFYFFDLGIKKAIDRTLDMQIVSSTPAFGNSFEHFFILECIRMKAYLRVDDTFYYSRTKDDVEIDLIIERPDRERIAIEIKSSDSVDANELRSSFLLARDMGISKFYVASREPIPRYVEGINILPWQDVLKEIGYIS